MAHHSDTQALRELTAPARNNYFYGKMLGVLHFEMEQAYFNRKRWLLNQFGLGPGVLCGLEMEVAEGGQQVWLRPGLAIDPFGREIIVPGSFCIDDPRQPTDDCGRPDGDRIEGEGAVTILLCYHECESEPVPVLVGDCDAGTACAPNLIRERFRLQVVSGEVQAPTGLTDEQCAAIFPEAIPDDFDRRSVACSTLTDACPVPSEECIPLGVVRLPGDATAAVTVEPCVARTTVYSNSRLFDLILCLADRLDACCAAPALQLRYVSGDAQSGTPGAALPQPLVVEVVDHEGNAVADETVTFTVRGGGGTVSPASVSSAADGRAETAWTLGPAEGLNTMAASISGAPEVPLFALGVAAPAANPPVILHMLPDPSMVLSPETDERMFGRWLEAPFLALTFDRRMQEDHLREPDALLRWLRVHQLIDRGEEITVRPVLLELEDILDDFEGRTGSTALWRLRIDEPGEPARYIVQARAEPGAITDTATPPLTLDAEFVGTRLSQTMRNRIFNADAEQQFTRTAYDGLTDTGAALPRSGDGNEGGEFDAWFEVRHG